MLARSLVSQSVASCISCFSLMQIFINRFVSSITASSFFNALYIALALTVTKSGTNNVEGVRDNYETGTGTDTSTGSLPELCQEPVLPEPVFSSLTIFVIPIQLHSHLKNIHFLYRGYFVSPKGIIDNDSHQLGNHPKAAQKVL